MEDGGRRMDDDDECGEGGKEEEDQVIKSPGLEGVIRHSLVSPSYVT